MRGYGLLVILVLLAIFTSVILVQAANVTTTQTETQCFDSDIDQTGLRESGRNYFVKGNTSNVFLSTTGQPPTVLGTRIDSCEGGILKENYCSTPSIVETESIDCSQINPSFRCIEGACVYIPSEIPTPTTITTSPLAIPASTCTDSDNGLNLFTKGKTGIQSQNQFEDFCLGDLIVQEYFCKQGDISVPTSLSLNCPSNTVCRDGACEQVIITPPSTAKRACSKDCPEGEDLKKSYTSTECNLEEPTKPEVLDGSFINLTPNIIPTKSQPGVGKAECLDKIDNDQDNFTDYPDDVGCKSQFDISETPDIDITVFSESAVQHLLNLYKSGRLTGPQAINFVDKLAVPTSDKPEIKNLLSRFIEKQERLDGIENRLGKAQTSLDSNMQTTSDILNSIKLDVPAPVLPGLQSSQLTTGSSATSRRSPYSNPITGLQIAIRPSELEIIKKIDVVEPNTIIENIIQNQQLTGKEFDTLSSCFDPAYEMSQTKENIRKQPCLAQRYANYINEAFALAEDHLKLTPEINSLPAGLFSDIQDFVEKFNDPDGEKQLKEAEEKIAKTGELLRNKKTDLELRKRILKQNPEYRETESEITDSSPLSEIYRELNSLKTESGSLEGLHFVLVSAKGRDSPEVKEIFRSQTEVKAKIRKLTVEKNKKERLVEIEQEFQQKGLQGESIDEIEKNVKELEELADPKTRQQKAQELQKKAEDRAAYLKSLDQNKIEEKISEKILGFEKLLGSIKDTKDKLTRNINSLKSTITPSRGCAAATQDLNNAVDNLDKANNYIDALEESNNRAKEVFSPVSKDINETIFLGLQVYQHLMVSSNHAESFLKKVSESVANTYNAIGQSTKCDLPCPLGSLPEYDPQEDGNCISCQNFYEKSGPYWGPKKWRTPEEVLSDKEIAIQRALAKLEDAGTPEEMDVAKEEYIKLREAQLEGDPNKKEIMDLEKQRIDDYVQKRKDFIDFNSQLTQVIELANSGRTAEAKRAFGNLKKSFDKIKTSLKQGAVSELTEIGSVIEENLQRGNLLEEIKKLEAATTKEEAESAANSITSITNNANFLDNSTKSKLLDQTSEVKERVLVRIKYKEDMDKVKDLLNQNQTADAYSFYATALSEAERTNDTLGIQYIQARINTATGGKGINKADIIIQFARDGRIEEIEKFLNLAKNLDEKISILTEAAQKTAEINPTQTTLIQTLLENLLQGSSRLKDKFILATVKYQKGTIESQRGDYQGIVEWRRLWKESSIILGELESQTLTQQQQTLVTQMKKAIDYKLRLDILGRDLRGIRNLADLGDVLAASEKDLISATADLQQGKIDAELYSDILIKHIEIKLGFWKRQRSTEQGKLEGISPDGITDLYNTLVFLQTTLRNQAIAQDKKSSFKKLVSEISSLLDDTITGTISTAELKVESIVSAAVEEEEKEMEVRERIEAGQDVSTKVAVDAEMTKVEAELSRIKSGYSGVSIVGNLWHKEQLTSYLEFLRQGVSTDARLALQEHREILKSLTAIKIELEKKNVETAIQNLDTKIKNLRSHLEVLNIEWDVLYKTHQSATQGPDSDKAQQDLDKKQQQMVDAEREIGRLQSLKSQESSLEFNKKREATQAEFASLSSARSNLKTQIEEKEEALLKEKAKYFWSRSDQKIKSLEKEIKILYEKLRTVEIQIIVVTTPEDSDRYSSQDPAEIESSYERVLVDEWTSELYGGTRFGGEETNQGKVRRLEHQLWILSERRQSIAIYRGLQSSQNIPNILSNFYNQRAQILLDEIDRREEIKNQPGATNPTFEILTGIINQNTYQTIAISRLAAELESVRQGQLSVLSSLQQENTQNHALIISSLIQSQIRLSQAEWTDRFTLLEEMSVFRPFVVGFQSAGRGAAKLTTGIYTTTFEQNILSKIDFSKSAEEIISSINSLQEEERKILSDGRRSSIGYTTDRKDVFDQITESRKRYAQLLLAISRGGQSVLNTIKQTDRIGYVQLVLTGWVSNTGELQTPPTLPEWITKSLFDENILPGADYLQASSVGRMGIVVVGGGLAARTGATIIGGLATGATGSAAAGQTAFWLTFPGLFVPGSNVIGGITYGEKGDYSLKHFASSYLTVWGLGGLGYLGRGLTKATGLTTAGSELASASLLRSLASNGIHFGFEVMGFWAGGQVMYGFTGDQHDRLTLEQALLTTIGLKLAGLPTHNTFTRFFDALGVKSAEFGDFFGKWYEKYSATLLNIRAGNFKAEEAMRQLAEQEKILRNALKRFGIENQITVEQATPEAVVNRIIDIIISRRVQKGEGSQQIVDTILNNRLRKGEGKAQVDYLRSELLKILQSGVSREEIIYRIQSLGFNRAEAESIIASGEGYQILEGLSAQMSGTIKRNFHLVADFTNPQQPTGRREVSREKLRSELLDIGLAPEEVQSIIALLEGGLFVVNPPQSSALATIKREQESRNSQSPPFALSQSKEIRLLSAPQPAPQGEQARENRQHESADVSLLSQPVKNNGMGDGVLSYDLTLADGRRVTRVVFADAKNHGQSAERLRNIVFDVVWRNRDLNLQEMLFEVDASLATRQQEGGDLGRSDFTAYVIADVDQATGEVEYSRSGNRFLAINFDPATGKVSSTEPIGNSFPLPIPTVVRNKMREDLFNPRMPLNTNKITLDKGVLVLFSDGFEDSKIGGQWVGQERIESLITSVVEDVLKNNPSATSEELTDAVLIEWNKFVEENNIEQTDDISLVIIRPNHKLPEGYTTEQYRGLITGAQKFGKELGFTERETQTVVAILTDGGFSAPLRHDIRTPATVINGVLDNLVAFGQTDYAQALSTQFDILTGSTRGYPGSLLDLFYTQYLIYLDLVAGRDPTNRLLIGDPNPLPTDKEGALKNFMILFGKIREEAAKIDSDKIDDYGSKVSDDGDTRKLISALADNSRRLVMMIEELTGGSTRPIDQWVSAFGRKVKLNIPPEASRYVTNARMVQLLINLVSNSERAANERGIKLDAALTVEIQGGVAVLTYADNAGGLDLQGILDSAKSSSNRQAIEKSLCRQGEACRTLDSLDPTNPSDKLLIARLIFAEGVTIKEQEPGMHGIGMAGVKSMLEKAAKEQGLNPSDVIEIFLVDNPPGTGFKITVPIMLLGDVLSPEEGHTRATALIESIFGPNLLTAKALNDGLVALGKSAIPAIMDAITKNVLRNGILRAEYIRTLTNIADSSVAPQLVNCLASCSLGAESRTAIQTALATLGDSSTLQQLIDFVKNVQSSSSNEQVVMASLNEPHVSTAIRTIGVLAKKTGDRSAVQFLTELLSGLSLLSNNAMLATIDALGDVGGSSAIDTLVSLIDAGAPLLSPVSAAANALVKIGDRSAIPKLTAILERELPIPEDSRKLEPSDIVVVITAIGDLSEKTGDKSATPILVEALRREQNAVAAARALGKVRDPSTADALYRYASGPNFELSLEAAKSLHLVGDPRGLQILIEKLKVHAISTDYERVEKVKSVLAEIGEAATKPLINAIREEHKMVLDGERNLDVGSSSRYFITNAVGVFVKLKSPEIVPYLIDNILDSKSAFALGFSSDLKRNLKGNTISSVPEISRVAVEVLINFEPTNRVSYSVIKPFLLDILKSLNLEVRGGGYVTDSLEKKYIAAEIVEYLGSVAGLMRDDEKSEAAALIIEALDYVSNLGGKEYDDLIAALASMGESAIRPIQDALPPKATVVYLDNNGKRGSIAALAQIVKNTGSIDAIRVLVSQLSEVTENTRESLGDALRKVGEPVVRLIIEHIEYNKDGAGEKTRKGISHAISVLGGIGGKKVVDFLIKVADPRSGGGERSVDPSGQGYYRGYNGDLKAEAIKALGDTKDPKAIPVLLEHLEAPILVPNTRTALEKIGQPAVQPLLEFIKKIQSKEESDIIDTQRITSAAEVILKIRYDLNLEFTQKSGLERLVNGKKSVTEFLEKLDGLIKLLKSEPTTAFTIDAEKYDNGQVGVGLETERVLEQVLSEPQTLDAAIQTCNQYCFLKPGERAIPAKLFLSVANYFIGKDGEVDHQSFAFLKNLFESSEAFKARFEKDRLGKSLDSAILSPSHSRGALRTVEKNLAEGKYKLKDGMPRKQRDQKKDALQDLNNILEASVMMQANKDNQILTREARGNIETFLSALEKGEIRSDLLPGIKKLIIEVQAFRLYGQMISKLGIDEETKKNEIDIIVNFLERNLQSGQAILDDVEKYLQINKDTEFWQNAKEALIARMEGKFSEWKYASPDFTAFMKEVREKNKEHPEIADKLEKEWKENTVYETADGYTVEITDDFETTFRIGTCPTRSCQAFDIGSHNYGLMAYVANGLNKIAILRDPSGRVIGRRIVRLRMFSDPILHLEDQYGSDKEWIDQALLLKAQAMGISGLVANAQSIGNHLPAFRLSTKAQKSSPVVTTYGGRAAHNYYDSRGIGDATLSAGETETYSFSAEVLTDSDISQIVSSGLSVEKIEAGQYKKPIIDQIIQIHQTLGLKLPVDIRTKLFALSFDDLTDELNKLRAEAAEKLDVSKFLNRIAQFSVGAAPGSVAEFAVEVKIRDYITEGLLKNDLAEISRAREILDSIRDQLSPDIIELTELVISEASHAILTRKPPEQVSRREDPITAFFRLDETLRSLGLNSKDFLDRADTLKSGTDYIIVGLLGEGESKFTLKIRLNDGRLAALHMPKSLDDQFDIQSFEKEISAAQNIYGAETASGRLGAEFLGEADLGYITAIIDGKHLDEMTPEEILSLYSKGLIPKIIQNARSKVHALADLGYGDFDLQFLVSQEGDVTLIDPENVGSEDSYLFVSPNEIENRIRRIVETRLAELGVCELCPPPPILESSLLPDDSPLSRFPSEGVGTPRSDYLILREIQTLLEQAESNLDLSKIEESRVKLKEAQAMQEIVRPEDTIPKIENIINELEAQIKEGRTLAEKAADILARTLDLDPVESRPNILSQEFNTKTGQTYITVSSMEGVQEILEQYAPGTALVIISKSSISSLPSEYKKSILGDPEGSSAQFRVGLFHAREYKDRFEIHRDAVDPRKQPIMHLWHDSPETLFGILTGATTAGVSTKFLWDTTNTMMDSIHAIPATVIPAALASIVTGYATHVGGKALRIAIKAYFAQKLREKAQGIDEAKREQQIKLSISAIEKAAAKGFEADDSYKQLRGTTTEGKLYRGLRHITLTKAEYIVINGIESLATVDEAKKTLTKLLGDIGVSETEMQGKTYKQLLEIAQEKFDFFGGFSSSPYHTTLVYKDRMHDFLTNSGKSMQEAKDLIDERNLEIDKNFNTVASSIQSTSVYPWVAHTFVGGSGLQGLVVEIDETKIGKENLIPISEISKIRWQKEVVIIGDIPIEAITGMWYNGQKIFPLSTDQTITIEQPIPISR